MPCAFDGVLFIIEKAFDDEQQSDVILAVSPVAGTVFRWPQLAKLGLPVSQNIRFEAGDATNLGDGVVEAFDRSLLHSGRDLRFNLLFSLIK